MSQMQTGTAAQQPHGAQQGQQQTGPAQQGQPQGVPAAQQPPARPEGISDEEWNALGDPGRNAIVRERARAQEAERQLAASRARPAPPQAGHFGHPGEQGPHQTQQQSGQQGGQNSQSGHGQQQTQQPGQPGQPGQQGFDTNDLAGAITRAVQAAVQPLYQANAQRDADVAAQAVMQAVETAAGPRFVDPTDALYGVDLQSVVDASGRPDQAKITAQLDSLLQRKPHLGKAAPDGRPHAQPGGPQGAVQQPQASLEEATKASLARMQAAHGIRPAATP